MVIGYLKRQKRFAILEEECDPIAYIEACKKLKECSTSTYTQNICNNNIAVGFIELREYEKALSFLKLIQLSKNKNYDIFYHLALLNCYVGLSDFENAKFEYENYIKTQRKKYSDNALNYSIDSIAMNYNYLVQKNSETAKYYLNMMYYQQKAYAKSITKRKRLNLIYNIASLEEELGDIENAVKNYKLVSESGNLLLVATASTDKLKELSMKANS